MFPKLCPGLAVAVRRGEQHKLNLVRPVLEEIHMAQRDIGA